MSRLGTAVITVYDISDGSTPTYTRYYSTFPGLHSEMGDPDSPGTGVTWTSLTGSPPSTAYWVAEKFVIDSVSTSWAIFPVQTKDGGLPFVTGTESGSNKPTLGDSVWIADALAAVIAFTGRPYTNQKEFGYGTTVVITYDDGKLTGTFKRSGSSDTWVAPADFIDGSLVVDGSIAAAQIQSNSITADKLILNSSTMTVSGNELAIVGAALNRRHTFNAGSSTASSTFIIDIPYAAETVYLTGCGAGGSRAAFGTIPQGQNGWIGGSGGAAGCWGLPIVLNPSHTEMRIIIGRPTDNVISGSTTVPPAGTSLTGGATTVQTRSGGLWTTILTLGGGYGSVSGKISGISGTYHTSSGGGHGSASPSVIPYTFTGDNGDSVTANLSGSYAVLSYTGSCHSGGCSVGSSIITDWPFGSRDVANTPSITYPLYLNTYGGFGYGEGVAGGAGYAYNSFATKNALGRPGFLDVQFGA